MGIISRIKSGWNAFRQNEDNSYVFNDYGPVSSFRPDRPRLTMGRDKSLITAIYNRIAVDCAAIDIAHVKLDEHERFVDYVEDSSLNDRFRLEANIDQTSRAFVQDVVLTMLDEGCVAIVPVETDDSPFETGSYDYKELRVGRIVDWYPDMVKIRVFHQETMQKEDIILPKRLVAIIENPFYSVMNETNSTAHRLMRKLALIDIVDENSGANKLDIIIQLPYAIKSDARRQQAEARRKDIESQLANSKHGIAYTDSTEHITQLNRSVENQLLAQIDSLTKTLYGQLGLTEEIMNQTADEKIMNNYYNRTIEPIMCAICEELKRKFLTKNARTRGESIMFFFDPFKLIPTGELAELADKLSRNEIVTANEFRQIIGLKPADDPNADTLQNPNMYGDGGPVGEDYSDIDGQLDELEAMINGGDSY